MIQRIQSVYLLLAIACLVAGLFFPIASFQDHGALLSISPLGVARESGTPVFSGPWGIPMVLPYVWIALMMTFSLFQYKNRPRQLFIGRINYFLLIVVIFFNYFAINHEFHPADVSWGAAFFLPEAALVFNFLANRGIKKDQDLVKSIDRLR